MLISFKEYWETPIIEGIKTQTMRGRMCEPGETLILAIGVRTKNYRRLGTAICEDCFAVKISHDPSCSFASSFVPLGDIKWNAMSQNEVEVLAHRDGFMNPWQLHGYFWAMHGLPWEGYIIRWKDFEKCQ